VAQFDDYRSSYRDVVEDSVKFSGLNHDFFLQAKIEVLEKTIAERRLGASQDIKALDVGCGIGALHPFSRALLPNLSGCDISAGSIARAREDNPWVDYRCYRAPDLPYDDETFDLAFAVCVVHHVPPAEWPSFIREMRRVVRPGGVVCIIEHNPLNPMTKLAVMRCPFDEDAVLLNRWKAEELLVSAGMKEVSAAHFLLLPVSGRASRTVERWLSRVPLGAQYACSALV
jgi:SAM-dependent methyltransferase